jgi:hypothetical protein
MIMYFTQTLFAEFLIQVAEFLIQVVEFLVQVLSWLLYYIHPFIWIHFEVIEHFKNYILGRNGPNNVFS